jgi:hypothetical protein
MTKQEWFMYQGDAQGGTASLAPEGAGATSLPAIAPPQRGWAWWLGTGITLAVLVVAVLQLKDIDLKAVAAMVPASPLFWLVFLLGYFSGPMGDFLIFRRLWGIPADGFLALVRKLIGNELVTGYVGDVYFYSWARQRTAMVSAPFGAIKDVAIMSAMASNAITLGLLALSFPLLNNLKLGIELDKLLLSGAVVVGLSSLVLFFRKTLFSLNARDLRFVALVQLGRVLAYVLLTGLTWHLALPSEDVQMWLVLAAMAMLLSRLPFLPNARIVFAGLAAFLIGHDAEVTRLMAMIAGLTLATHLLIGVPLMAREALGWRR